MKTSFGNDREYLNSVIRAAIRFWEEWLDDNTPRNEERCARDRLAILVGYKTRDVIDRIMADPTVLPGPIQMWRIVKGASEKGFDAACDAFSSDDKVSMPVYAEADGCVMDDASKLLEGGGNAVTLFRGNNGAAYMQRVDLAARGVQGLKMEGYHRFFNEESRAVCGRLFGGDGI